MAGATLTTLSNILKEMYLPPVVDQINNEILVLSRWDVNKKDLVGLQANVPLHTGRSGGIGARPELGTLPTAYAQSYAKAVYNLKYLYGTIQVSGPSIQKTKNSSGAFLEAYKSELDGIKDDLMNDLARQFYGNGDARLATCGVTTASNVVVLNSAEPIRQGFLYIGQVVDIGTAADPNTLVSGEVITAINESTPSITVTTAITTTTANFVYTTGNTLGTDATVVYEIDAGLQKLVSTSANTVGGINAATNAYWDNLRDTAGGALTEDNLLKNWNNVRIRGGKPSLVLSSFGLQRVYFNALQGNRRYVEPTKLRGGFESLEFQGQAFVADRHAPYSKLFILDESKLMVFSPADWDFLARDGQAVKWVQNIDAFQSILFRYINIGTNRRNVQLVMSGLTDALGY
jgi:hypothetical protein